MNRIIMARSNHVDPDSRVEKEANSLAKAGYQVTLLTWDRSENYWIKSDKKRLNDSVVTRISFGARAEFGVGMKSLFPYIKFQISLFFWLLKNRKEYDICHFCDFDTALTGSYACKLVKKKYVFDIFDYLSTNAVTVFQKIIERKENRIINRADATIICTEQRKAQIKKSRPKNLVVVHNSPEVISVEKSEKNKGTKIKIVYVGILQDYRLIKEMIHAVSTMPRIELHIGGFGKYEKFVEDASRKCNNIIYYGKLSYDKTLQLENSCDLMTAIYDPMVENHKYAAPNKFYEGLYLGKPLVMVKGTGMSEIIEKEKIGVLIDYSEQGFIDGINELIMKQSEWEKMKKRMKELYIQKYSWNEMENRLLKLYSEF